MISKRLQREMIQLQDKSLKETGIYYFNKDSLTSATAIMFGPKDTPYEYCPLEFRFIITNEYPFSPPLVKYHTNDGRTRFHPNFYIDGKVCLSILGTYSGPKWASSMNISTVLLSIYSLMTNNPLSHEPCYEKTNLSNTLNKHYADVIEHNMVKLFLEMYTNNYYKEYIDEDDDFKKVIEENVKLIKNKIVLKSSDDEKKFTALPYSMVCLTSWKKLREKYC